MASTLPQNIWPRSTPKDGLERHTTDNATPGPPSSAGPTPPPVATSRQRSQVISAGSNDSANNNTVDPLSLHILQLTGNVDPSNGRRKDSIMEEPVVASRQGTESFSPSGQQRLRNPVEVAGSQESAGLSGSAQSKDKRKSSRSFLSRLIGKKSDETDEEDSSTEFGDRMEGNDALAFSQPLDAISSKATPKYIRIRSRNIAGREFGHMFLAQELQTPELPARDADQGSNKSSINETTPSINSNASKGAIWALKFSIDGRYIACGGQDMIVWVWSIIESAEKRAAYEAGEIANQQISGTKGNAGIKLNAPVFHSNVLHSFAGHTADVLDLSWSKNNFLLSSSMDKTVRLWHVSRKECLCSFQHSDFVTSIAFHPLDDRYFLSGSLDCKLRLWSIPNKSVTFWNELPELITAVAFTPDGKYVVVGTFVGLCLFYETDNLRYYTQIHVRSSRGKNAKGHKITGIEAMAIPPRKPHADTRLLITSNDSRVRMYNFRDKSLELKLKGNENSSSQIRASFSDDGSYVICGSEDRQVYIWHISYKDASPDPVGYERFEAHSNVVTCAVFAPLKSRHLLAASGDPIYELSNKALHPTSSLSSLGGSSANINGGASPSLAPVASNSSLNGSQVFPKAKSSKSSLYSDGQIIVCADYTGKIKIFRQDSAFNARLDTSDSLSISKRSRSTRLSSNNTRPSDRASWRDSVGPSVNLDSASLPPSRPASVTSLSISDTNNSNGHGISTSAPGKHQPAHDRPASIASTDQSNISKDKPRIVVRPASQSNAPASTQSPALKLDTKDTTLVESSSKQLPVPSPRVKVQQFRTDRLAIQDTGVSMAYYFPDNISDRSESDEPSDISASRRVSEVSVEIDNELFAVPTKDERDMTCGTCQGTTFRAYKDRTLTEMRLQCTNCGSIMS